MSVRQEINGTVMGSITRDSTCLTEDLMIFKVTGGNFCQLFSGVVRVFNNKVTWDVSLLCLALVSMR